MKPFRGKTRTVEVHPGEPIHLGIEKTRTGVQFHPAEITVKSFLKGGNLDDLSFLNHDVHGRLCPRNFPLNDHDDVSGELYRIFGGFNMF
jgi:hypothetical protein